MSMLGFSLESLYSEAVFPPNPLSIVDLIGEQVIEKKKSKLLLKETFYHSIGAVAND